MIDPSAEQEQFSRAYVHAVITVAGFAMAPPCSPDDDSVDLTITARGPVGRVRSPRIDVQLKSVRQVVDRDPWTYPLKVKNYDDLRLTDYAVPRVLVVVALPEDPAGWLRQSEAELALRHCGYWASLRGLPATVNERTVSIPIPRAQVFSVEGVRAMLARVGQGGMP